MKVEFYISIDADPSELLDWVIEYGNQLAAEHGGSFDEATAVVSEED